MGDFLKSKGRKYLENKLAGANGGSVQAALLILGRTTVKGMDGGLFFVVPQAHSVPTFPQILRKLPFGD